MPTHDDVDVFLTTTAEDALRRLSVPTQLLYAEWSVGAGSAPAYTDDEVAAVWRAAMWGKAPAHGVGEAEPVTASGFARPSRSMSAIGG